MKQCLRSFLIVFTLEVLQVIGNFHKYESLFTWQFTNLHTQFFALLPTAGWRTWLWHTFQH